MSIIETLAAVAMLIIGLRSIVTLWRRDHRGDVADLATRPAGDLPAAG